MRAAKRHLWMTRWMGAITGIAFAALSLHVFASTPAVTVRLAPVAQWREDALFLADMLKERPDSDKLRALAGALDALAKNGLDANRPLGLICHVNDDGKPVVIGCLPVSDLDRLHMLAKNWMSEPVEVSANVYRVTIRNRDLYVRIQGDWVLVGLDAQALDSVPADSGEWFRGLSDSAEVAIKIDPQQLIRLDKKAIREFLKRQERVTRIASRVAGSQEVREAITEPVLETAMEAIRQTDHVTINCQIDRTEKKLLGSYTWAAKAGSDLAEHFAQQRYVTSPLVAIRDWKDSVFTMGWSATFPAPSEENLRSLGGLIQNRWHQQIDQRISNQSAAQNAKALADDLLELLGDWARVGKMDGVITLVSSPDQITLLVGGYVANSAGLENWVGNLIESAQQQVPRAFDRVTILPNHTFHGDATIHLMQISLKDKLAPEQIAVLGEDIEVAFTAVNGYAAVAIGKNAVGVIKRAIDDAVALGDRTAPAFECKLKIDDLVAALARVLPQDSRLQQLKSDLEQCEGVQAVSKKVEFSNQQMAVMFEMDLNLLTLPKR